ncbi:hypothetical protein [Paraburkholderia sp. BCC1886]|uniref:hypothetical protein n=1 Tax=Paraburkholderia sp. BCC1886 TaxID=2562670 RepID=UPI001183C211|nr:hypothetical protein [Paraburkholderia sp. BCC1886]
MSLSLSLIIDQNRQGLPDGTVQPFTRLRFSGYTRRIEEAVRSIAIVLDAGLDAHDDEKGSVVLTTDNYGSPLCWLSAGTLAPILRDAIYDQSDAAVVAYIEAMPADTRVILYWW